ncbi:MAG: hypothetical protein Q8P25_05195, partial [Candidatus Curtissbacteria bacterium]|nr:hypothetical protein [Candidatus Curtissbacteria bacterium]
MSADRKVKFGFTPVGEALNDLPQDLREWLDGHSPVLTFRVSKFIIGELISGDNVWTAEKVEFE